MRGHSGVRTMLKLQFTAGPRAGEEIELEAELTFGRENAEVVIADPELSRRHAILRPSILGVEVEDLGSLNGTTIDGERVSGRATAGNRATIRMGTTSITVVSPDPQATRISSPQDRDRTAFRPRPEYQPTVIGRVPEAGAGTPPVPAETGAPPVPAEAGTPPGPTVDPEVAAWVGGPDAAPASGASPARRKRPLFVRIAPKFLLRRFRRKPPPGHGPPQ
jgi:hypothetical protein